ncbi:CrfX protein [Pseudomonas sp.]|uniref:CrfX protein n=1 Tax=Pseudomonas sp. TaxID=306 RepID=UPI003568B2A6
MPDPFEESLRDMLKSGASDHDDDACLHRVLKTANRQVGAGDLFALMGHWLGALMIALNSGSAHVSPVTRRDSSASTNSASTNKAD